MSPRRRKPTKFKANVPNGAVVHENLSKDLIFITADRAEVILRKYKDALMSNVSWITPTGFAFTFWLTFLTTEFTDGIRKFIPFLTLETHRSVFLLLALFTSCVAVREFLSCSKRKKEYGEDGVEFLIDNFKKAKSSQEE